MKNRILTALAVSLACLCVACGSETTTVNVPETGEPQPSATTTVEASPSGEVNVSELPAIEAEAPEKIIIAGPAPFEAHGKLSVAGTGIIDSNGDQFQIKGVSTHGIAWFPQYVNYDAFLTIRDDWGGNCIRLAMYSDENSGYCSGGNQDKLKGIVKDGVDYATQLGMYVIIDWHVLGEHNPNVHKDEAKLFFEEMSKLYADYDNVLYEICNEPNGDTDWNSVKSYAEEIIPVIKANNPDALIIIGTPTWSQDVDKAAADPIEGYNNLLYTIHFYADTHRQDLRNRVQSAIDSGLPLFCSEFGICDASGNGHNNVAEANKWIELFDNNNISYCIWNLSNKNESSSLINPGCIKKDHWEYNDLSEEGQWYYDLLGGNTHLSDYDTVDPAVPQAVSGDLSVNIVDTNSWNDGNSEFCQYDVSISNNGPSIDSWHITVEFDKPIEISQSWNGIYTSSDNIVNITPESYNSTLERDSSISDIGFIIKSSESVTITKVSIN